MDRMNSADEKVFEEALSGALADIQSDWENPDALLLACKDALPPDYVPSRRFSRKMQRLLRRSKKTAIWFFRRRQTLDSQIGSCFVGGIAELCGS
ncbi:MAG: hypothetical protein V8T62_05720 [Oscillospiraceae bacterium]